DMNRPPPLSWSLLLCAAFAGLLFAQDPSNPTSKPDGSAKRRLNDTAFIEQAATGSLTEIELSKLALKKTRNEKLRQFAEQMMADHETVNQRLKQVAQRKGLSVPTALTAVQQQKVQQLQAQGA